MRALPEVDLYIHCLKKARTNGACGRTPGPALASASAPESAGPKGHFDGESQVKDFIRTLLKHGGYNEMADTLVNPTLLATEMGRFVSYMLTVLVPVDEAMAELTVERLSELGARKGGRLGSQQVNQDRREA